MSRVGRRMNRGIHAAHPPARRTPGASDRFPEPVGLGPNMVMAPPRQQHPLAETVFTLGILGLFVGVAAPIALILGGRARREIKQNPERYDDRGGMAVSGMALGGVITALMAVGLFFFMMLLAFALAW